MDSAMPCVPLTKYSTPAFESKQTESGALVLSNLGNDIDSRYTADKFIENVLGIS